MGFYVTSRDPNRTELFWSFDTITAGGDASQYLLPIVSECFLHPLKNVFHLSK